MRHGQESIQVAMIRLLRLGLTRQMRILLGLIVAAIALCSFIAGIVVGSLDRSGDIDGECLAIRQDSTKIMEEARRYKPDTALHRLKARTSLYQVINNSGCFSAIDLATAQAALDELNIPQPTPDPPQ
ncbi:hypothetical protein AB0K60_35690 [Thermopolyspora sp. NPDC052614]|uniref:hypothetical protein n=1 Tax=Thermopolyspora sp. NPDC052614 TaxID=3155682 RepID=UPI0034380D95